MLITKTTKDDLVIKKELGRFSLYIENKDAYDPTGELDNTFRMYSTGRGISLQLRTFQKISRGSKEHHMMADVHLSLEEARKVARLMNEYVQELEILKK